TCIQLITFNIELVTMQLLQEVRDLLDGFLSLLLSVCANANSDSHKDQWRGDGESTSASCSDSCSARSTRCGTHGSTRLSSDRQERSICDNPTRISQPSVDCAF